MVTLDVPTATLGLMKSSKNPLVQSRAFPTAVVQFVALEECLKKSSNLTIVVSENGRKSYRFTTPLLEGYMLGRDPYREFRKGIKITTYQDDSLSTANATLESNYAIYYENRKLWEAKGNVRIVKHDGTRVYTQQLFWNSTTKRIYSNVDTKIVTADDTHFTEGFDSDEDLVIVAAAFSGKVKKAYPTVPSYSCLQQRVENGSGVFASVQSHLTLYPSHTDRALKTVSYFDINNIVSFLKVPVDFFLGLTDPACLPPFVYSPYAHTDSPKKITIAPFTPHTISREYKLELLKELSEL